MHQTVARLAGMRLDVLVEGQEDKRGGDGSRATRARHGEIAYAWVVRITLIKLLHRFCGQVFQAFQGDAEVVEDLLHTFFQNAEVLDDPLQVVEDTHFFSRF